MAYDIEQQLNSFLDSFELVFENDWDVSISRLADTNNHYISEHGTFLNPGVDDESNNWGNRGSLLASIATYVRHSEDRTQNNHPPRNATRRVALFSFNSN